MMNKVSSTNMMRKNDEKTFSNFGRYQINKEIILNLPNNVITIHDIGNGKLSYIRNSENKTIKKIIQVQSKTQLIELVPVLPIHVPAYKTDFFFLRFEEPVFIEESSTMETTISFPIEIGIFLVNQNKANGFDFFSCDPLNSRFGLYGTPEDGRLCKYGTTLLADKYVASQPFIHAQLKLEITNHLDESVQVGKIVFPVTDHDLYYCGNEVMIDGLQATIKNRMGLHVIETIQNPIVIPTEWHLAPRDTEKTDYKFSMEKGFE